ncbi:MAG: methyltransferase domain-containing protein [Neisseriaceae bacterium]
MQKIRDWLTKTTVGRALLQEELVFIQAFLDHLQQSRMKVMILSPVDLFFSLSLPANSISFHLSPILPCAIRASFDHIPFASESMDVVVCYHGLERTENKALVIEEISRVLKPEGHLIISVFNPRRLWLRQPQWKGQPILKRTDSLYVHELALHLKKNALCVIEGRFMFYTPLLGGFLRSGQVNIWEKVGNRWWPDWSNVYMMMAKKEVLAWLNSPLMPILGTPSDCLVPLVRLDDHT